ncbi:LLM class flavin-dependent oxidoreductase [Pseudomonas sp. 910_23]|uniref:MupA/Atu3671 family FMN-dependent luciferase-like monooxygenase n=1 Tax=Pseudomonas sp. 910_23 TaxID=2604461 RepID=UPI004063C7D7
MSVEQLLGLGVTNAARAPRQPAFSLLFFSDVREDISASEKYEFARSLTLFGDAQGFEAVYFPERHFHEFGAIYPDSAVMAASLIPQTRHIRFRTAGISLPLHHPARVVESWSMNDVLSGGRVDLGFGSGWSRPDFLLAPHAYEDRREVMWQRIEQVRRLWAGERLSFPGPGGDPVSVVTFPRPLQTSLNVWILVAKNTESFIAAGKAGFNVFTMLYGIDLPDLAEKIGLYRQARRDAGFDPASGRVTLMLHTLVGPDSAWVRRAVEAPFKDYIRSSLVAHMKARATPDGRPLDATEQENVLQYAFERYYETGALFGTVDEVRYRVGQVLETGIDEIACLMDFGVDYAVVHQSLPYLEQLVASFQERSAQ